MRKVTIYTDGCCKGNPGAGGWAAVILCGSIKKEISGFKESTTNNEMELTAVIQAISCVKVDADITIYSDSQYVVNGANSWIFSWVKNGFVKADGSELKNRNLWLRYWYLRKPHKIKFVWVKGHSNNQYNNRCDELANLAVSDNAKKVKQNKTKRQNNKKAAIPKFVPNVVNEIEKEVESSSRLTKQQKKSIKTGLLELIKVIDSL